MLPGCGRAYSVVDKRYGLEAQIEDKRKKFTGEKCKVGSNFYIVYKARVPLKILQRNVKKSALPFFVNYDVLLTMKSVHLFCPQLCNGTASL